MGLAPSIYEGVYIIAAVSAGLFSAFGYLFRFPDERYSSKMTKAEEEIWDEICKEYGAVVANLYNDVENSANYYTSDLDEPGEVKKVAKDLLEGPIAFEQFETKLNELRRPREVFKRCRMGAMYAPWLFMSSAILSFPLLFVEQNMLYQVVGAASFVAFFVGLILSIRFLRNRHYIHKLSDSNTFMT